MTSICQRLQEEACQLPSLIAVASVAGCLFGYVYAKFADLPVRASMKAWTIYSLAGNIFKSLAHTLTLRPSKRALILASVDLISLTVGLSEMQRRGLMGAKMVAFMCCVVSSSIFEYTLTVFRAYHTVKENDTYDSIAQKFGVSTKRISQLNNFDSDALPALKVGDVLLVDSLFK